MPKLQPGDGLQLRVALVVVVVVIIVLVVVVISMVLVVPMTFMDLPSFLIVIVVRMAPIRVGIRRPLPSS
jgi:hypothetical protein